MANNITDEEITRLAREYAEYSSEEVGLPICLQDETFGLVVTETECVLKWLLRSHCLVEKSKLVRCYKIEADAAKAFEDKIKTSIQPWAKSSYYQHKAECERTKQLLETLFGDTLKEEGV